MDKLCENDLCQRPAAGQVPVSIEGHCDQKRFLCGACKAAYDWGLQQGRRAALPLRVWVLAVSDMGLVVHSGAFRTRRKAVQGLAEYLRTYEGYRGPATMPSISDWLAERAQDLGVDMFPAPLHTG